MADLTAEDFGAVDAPPAAPAAAPAAPGSTLTAEDFGAVDAPAPAAAAPAAPGSTLTAEDFGAVDAVTAAGVEPEKGGWIQPATVALADIKKIAEHHGVSDKDLASLVAWRGGLSQGWTATDLGKFAAGEVGEAVGLGMPQWVYKKLQSEKMQHAIDDLDSLIQEKKSTLQSGLELVGGVAASGGLAGGVTKGAGLLGARALAAAKTLYPFAAAATGGAVSGLAHSETGDELSSAALGGSIGAGLGAVAAGLGSLTRLTPKDINKFALTGNQTLTQAVESWLKTEAPRIELTDALRTRRRDFGPLLQKLLGSGDYTELEKENAIKAIGRAKKKAYAPHRVTSAERVVQGMSDALPVLDTYDKRLGTDLARSATNTSARSAEMALGWEKIAKAPVTEESFARLRQLGEEVGGLEDLPQEMPVRYKPLQELKEALYDRWQTKGWQDEELQEQLSRLVGREVKPSPVAVKKALTSVMNDQGVAYKVAMNKGSVLNKTAEEIAIPVWAQETNQPRLLQRYAQEISGLAVLEQHGKEVQRALIAANAVGDLHGVDYLQKYYQDLFHLRPNIPAEELKRLAAFRTTAQKELTGSRDVDKALWRGRSEVPDAVNQMVQANIYHNSIGGSNLSSIVTNLLSPYTTAVSELGADHATKLAVGAVGDLLKIMFKGEEIILAPGAAARLGKQTGEKYFTRNPALVAYNYGLMGPQWQGEVLDHAVRSFKKSALASVAQGWNNVNMGLFETSEKIGRGVVAMMGRRLAQNIAENPALINQVIKSPSYRREIQRLAQGGLSPKLNQEVVRYLNAHTMLNFDRMNMSEFSRQAGPLFRQFTKIPFWVAGRAYQSLYDKGAARGLAEWVGGYGAPIIGLHFVDQLLNTKDNPRLKKIIGGGGFAGLNLGASLTPVLESRGGLMNTPLLSLGGAALKAGQAVYTGTKSPGEAAYYLANDIYRTVGLGSGLIRLLGEDYDKLVLNKDPDPTAPKMERNLQSILSR